MNNIVYDVNTAENDNHIILIDKLVKGANKCREIIKESRPLLRIYSFNKDNDIVQFDNEEIIKINEMLKQIGLKLKLAMPEFVWPIPEDPSSLEIALGRFSKLTLNDWKQIAACNRIEEIVANVSLDEINDFGKVHLVTPDNLPELQVLAKGVPGSEAIIIIPPCAVPIRVFEPMIDEFSKHYFTITFENPYLFHLWRSLPEPSGNISDEVDYIGAVLKEFNITHAHLVGICGGAPIALAAAEKFGDLIKSIVVCHGDLKFGSDVAQTPFKQQFASYLSGALKNEKKAIDVHTLFLDPSLLHGVSDELGPFIMYPYADFKLFMRYSKLNLALMEFDATKTACNVNQPTLIITSCDDRMAHPEGSYRLHQIILDSELKIKESGSHHDILLENKEIYNNILEFINGTQF
ncbi:alpha/beta hydrolase [Clostridium sp.]|nr:alpha/beta hydrolase [Clostridium sp.]